jgi:hypothetical protein
VVSSEGTAKYAVDQALAGPLTVALAFDSTRYRLCIGLACPSPAQVRWPRWLCRLH